MVLVLLPGLPVPVLQSEQPGGGGGAGGAPPSAWLGSAAEALSDHENRQTKALQDPVAKYLQHHRTKQGLQTGHTKARQEPQTPLNHRYNAQRVAISPPNPSRAMTNISSGGISLSLSASPVPQCLPSSSVCSVCAQPPSHRVSLALSGLGSLCSVLQQCPHTLLSPWELQALQGRDTRLCNQVLASLTEKVTHTQRLWNSTIRVLKSGHGFQEAQAETCLVSYI